MVLLCTLYNYPYVEKNKKQTTTTKKKKNKSSQGLSESNKKSGVTTHFSEIIELKFGKKLPYILYI